MDERIQILTDPPFCSRCDWRRDPPDFRDHIVGEQSLPVGNSTLPLEVDFSSDFLIPECVTEDHLGASIAVGGLFEYYQLVAKNRNDRLSKRFLANISQRLTQQRAPGLRSTLRAARSIGIPPAYLEKEELGPNDPFLYASAVRFRECGFARIEKPSTSTLKHFLASRQPMVFGFSTTDSVTIDPCIDLNPLFDRVIGSTYGTLVGFNDNVFTPSKGAFLFRSVWGSSWGNQGFGWLAYSMIDHGMIGDVWKLDHEMKYVAEESH